MSGYTMTVNRYDYQRKMRESAANRAEAQAAKESLQREQARSREMERKRREAEEAAARSRKEAAAARAETADLNRRFNQQIDQLSRRQQAEQAQIRQDFESIRLTMGQMNTRIHDVSAQIQNLSKETAAQFRAVVAQKESARDAAACAIKELQGQLKEMEGLSPGRFEGGRFSTLRQQLEAGEASLRAGNAEAALGTANVCLPEAYALKGRLIIQNQQFADALLFLRREASALQAELETLGSRQVSFELGGERVTRPCDVNFWTRGAVSELQTRFAKQMELLSRVEEDESIGFSGLDEIAAALAAVREEAGVATEQATSALIRSEAAMQQALAINDVMTASSWQREIADYCGGDEREDMSLVYGDGNGNRVAFRIGGNDSGKPNVDFIVYDAEDDYARARQASEQIGQLLHEEIGAKPDAQHDCRKAPDLEQFTAAV